MSVRDARRDFCIALAMTPLSSVAHAAGSLPELQVWKSPTCGCCQGWIKHLEQAGFSVVAHNTGNNSIRQRLGMPVKFGACHTARVSGYVVEGHVPAAAIIRLLRQKPEALGIAVPQMPIGSPGMDGPAYKGRRDPYDVLLVQRDGSASIFESYR